jgi:mRNA interferase HigB
LISLPPVLAFVAKHPDAKQIILAQCDAVRKARWTQPRDIVVPRDVRRSKGAPGTLTLRKNPSCKPKRTQASLLKSGRILFKLKAQDNEYRMVVSVAFKTGVVAVKFVGTHRDYEAAGVNHF